MWKPANEAETGLRQADDILFSIPMNATFYYSMYALRTAH